MSFLSFVAFHIKSQSRAMYMTLKRTSDNNSTFLPLLEGFLKILFQLFLQVLVTAPLQFILSIWLWSLVRGLLNDNQILMWAQILFLWVILQLSAIFLNWALSVHLHVVQRLNVPFTSCISCLVFSILLLFKLEFVVA